MPFGTKKQGGGVKPQVKKTPYKRIALVLSLLALIVWGILGTGTSLAWFTDTSPEINNIFHFADFELEVSHYIGEEKWETMTARAIFLMMKLCTSPDTCRSYI